MQWVRKKMCSQRGASILLALLLLLLCGMVGASIMAAAMSNGGRFRSNREEQQRYFVLSSALQLVCGWLEGAEYMANAQVEVVTKSDAEGEYTYNKYTQNKGEFTFTGTNVDPEKVLPLTSELDWLFAQTFPTPDPSASPPVGGGYRAGDHVYQSLLSVSGSDISGPSETGRTLTIRLESLQTDAPADLQGDIEGLQEKAEVMVRLGKDPTDKYHFFLEAKLIDRDGKVVMTMKAELRPDGIPYITDSSTYNDPTTTPVPADSDRKKLKWKLVRIYKE